MPNQPIRDDDESIFDEILKRSATDRAFRERLVAEPAGAIEEVIGVPMSTLPRPIKVRFIEKDPGLDAVVVLPDFQDPEGILSDAELEEVAGGCYISCVCSSCCISSISSEQEKQTLQ